MLTTLQRVKHVGKSSQVLNIVLLGVGDGRNGAWPIPAESFTSPKGKAVLALCELFNLLSPSCLRSKEEAV